MNRKLLHLLAYVSFFTGILLGFALAVISTWSRVEAINYFFKGAKYDPFNGLRCPVLMSPTETGMVNAVFNNRTNEPDTFFYRAEISGAGSVMRRIENQITVSSHQTKSIRLTVDAKDIDLLFFIFVKMNILPNSVHPSQEAVCGIMIANILGLSGRQLATLTIILSFLGIALGLGLWQQTSTKADRNTQSVIQALGFVVLFAMLAGALGWWIAGTVLSAIALLLLVISLRSIFPE